jgi:hypothetical protein
MMSRRIRFMRRLFPLRLAAAIASTTAHLRGGLCLLLLITLCAGWLSPLPSLASTRGRAVDAAPAARLLAPTAPLAPAANSDDELVYLDAQGYIRATDPAPPTSGATVEWVSPTSGWRDIALGDVNNDGDLEIIAVGGEAASGRLVIYDPVITTGEIDPARITNEVPWAVLYEAALPGRPLQVATGDLNPGIAGVEIAFVFELNLEDRLDPDDKSRLSLWQQALASENAAPDGRRWTAAAADVDFGNTWEHLFLGNLDNAAGEEIALVDDGVGLVRVYRLEEVVDEERAPPTTRIVPIKLYENESGARPWLDGVVARFIPVELQQLALARSSSPGGSTFWVLYYEPGAETDFSDAYTEFFLPPPRTIFAGDIDNNGDDELFLLRDVPNDGSNRPRLIMRNYDNANDPLPLFELTLDADNGYTAGVAGDTDGDGRDEVIIMRNNNIRIYTAPESTMSELTDRVPAATTDQRTILAGNLDRNGVLVLPKLSTATPLANQITLYAGEQRTEPLQINTLPSGAPGPIPFTLAVADEPAWLALSSYSGTTNATVDVQVDATKLPAGRYQTTITIASPDQTVINAPLTINVLLVVRAGLVPTTKTLSVPYNCSQESGSIEQLLPLEGPANLIFSAAVNGTTATGSTVAGSTVTAAAPNASTVPTVIWPSAKPWVSASSPNLLPTTVVLTFDPTKLADGVTTDQAVLSFVFYDDLGRQERTVALTLYCAPYQRYLPLIRR